MTEFDNLVAVVTGGASGIGAAIAADGGMQELRLRAE
jgi:NADP-dependent 3-hydroxy acid dehydrogenase YdfG